MIPLNRLSSGTVTILQRNASATVWLRLANDWGVQRRAAFGRVRCNALSDSRTTFVMLRTARSA